MVDKEVYKPHKPEKYITVTIARNEAILIQKLRKNAYGKITVHKMDGKIIRIETNASELIDEDTEIEL